jgi:hypothetical protein
MPRSRPARHGPIEQLLEKPQGSTLKGLQLDHVFGDLVRDGSGKATMWVKGKSERVEVVFGPNYKSVVVYAPGGPNRDFICFEPMTGITDALNLAHKACIRSCSPVAPGGTWQESFLGPAERVLILFDTSCGRDIFNNTLWLTQSYYLTESPRSIWLSRSSISQWL